MRFIALLACSLLWASAGTAWSKSPVPPAFLATVPTQSELEQQAPPVKAPSVGPRLPSSSADLGTMIGQMIILGFPGTKRGQEWPDRIARMIQTGQIGGTILFSGNVVNIQQLSALTGYLAHSGRSPTPFICVDQEGGTIQRLTSEKGFISLPSARSVAKMDQPAAYRLYRRSANQLAALGFNVNFGPVVDLDLNPDSPAIGRLGRSYDRDPNKVASFAKLFIEAHKQAGIMTAAKHFPGHGSAGNDSHDATVNIAATWQEQELLPFRQALGNNSSMIMVGHLIHPRFSDEDLPASLSRRTIRNALRQQLGFNGLVITDDLDMGAIRERFKVEEAAVLAIGAGADLIIIANNKMPDAGVVDRVTNAIIQAVQAGRISPETLKQSHDRIIAAKARLAHSAAYAGPSAQ